MQTFTVRIDPNTGQLDQETLWRLLAAVEDYIERDMVDVDDNTAVLAASVLQRHFVGGKDIE